jgi:hypothetical protein
VVSFLSRPRWRQPVLAAFIPQDVGHVLGSRRADFTYVTVRRSPCEPKMMLATYAIQSPTRPRQVCAVPRRGHLHDRKTAG